MNTLALIKALNTLMQLATAVDSLRSLILSYQRGEITGDELASNALLLIGEGHRAEREQYAQKPREGVSMTEAERDARIKSDYEGEDDGA